MSIQTLNVVAAQRGALIGRAQDQEHVVRLMSRSRLVTLTGMIGVGKTSLALEIAARRRAEFADGVFVLDFARPGSTAGALGDLHAAGRTLVLLDNCDQAVEQAAGLANELLSAHDDLRVVATGRRVLRVPGEVVRTVRPLRVDAVELFVRRASAALSARDLGRLDLAVLREICAELDGVPAAIELAVDALRGSSPEALLDRLRQDDWAVGARLAKTALAQCSATERRVCAELASLDGSFSRTDAEYVCADHVPSGEPVADVVAALADRSILLRVDDDPRARYVLPRIFRRHCRALSSRHRGTPRRTTAARESTAVTGTVPRTALLRELESNADVRLRLVCGPAGAGKSVLLRQLAARSGQALVRCTGSLVAPLATALGLRQDVGLPEVLDHLADRTVLVDDAHTLAGRPDAAVLPRLLSQAPPSARLVVATRDERPLRVAEVHGAVRRVGPADLRMTPDEVARLFATVYRIPLPEQDIAALCERVDGLAVAFRLLYLDTALARRALRDPIVHSGRLREFLAREVLAAVPESLVDFMIDASPLGLLDPALCDRHVGGELSAVLLAELAARQAFTVRVRSQGAAYRFHPLLRRLLEDLHLRRRGVRVTQQRFHSAARRLAAAGHWADAYRGYAHADDWVSAASLRHRAGAAPHDEDPWILLAEARRLRGDGRFAAARDHYLAAEDRLTDHRARERCAVERSRLTPWIAGGQPGSPFDDDVSEHLAAAVRGEPGRLVAMELPSDSPEWTLGRAVAAVLDGNLVLAIELAESIAGRTDHFVSLSARLVAVVVRACRYGQGSVSAFRNLAAEAEVTGWPWLARIARAAAAVLDEASCADAATVVAACDDRGDDWGGLLATLLLAVGQANAGCRDAAASRADAGARARRLGVRLPASWLTAPGQSVHVLPRVGAVAVAPDPVPRQRLSVVSPPAEVRCLGPFELLAAGRPVDLGELRAQARRVLRMLSLQYGRPMHEERLVVGLWPDTALERAKHRLHVAISSVRVLLRATYGAAGGVDRQGSTYLLRLPADSVVDVVRFDAAMRRWRADRIGRGVDELRDLGRAVLDLYRGELLVEEGSAEWVLARREAIRGEAVGVAAELATVELEHGDVARAVEACERGLAVDDSDYRLWTLLGQARQREGSPGAARRARQLYQTLVAEA
jgi:DNA-binding SARP family transcriptional activator